MKDGNEQLDFLIEHILKAVKDNLLKIMELIILETEDYVLTLNIQPKPKNNIKDIKVFKD